MIQEFTILKYAFVNYKIKTEGKTITITTKKNELKYSPMSESSTYIAEPNLEALPLI